FFPRRVLACSGTPKPSIVAPIRAGSLHGPRRMTHCHTDTATSNEARTTPTYIRDVPVILYAPPPTQGHKVRHTSRSLSSGGFGSFWRKSTVLCLSPAGLVLLPAVKYRLGLDAPQALPAL